MSRKILEDFSEKLCKVLKENLISIFPETHFFLSVVMPNRNPIKLWKFNTSLPSLLVNSFSFLPSFVVKEHFYHFCLFFMQKKINKKNYHIFQCERFFLPFFCCVCFFNFGANYPLSHFDDFVPFRKHNLGFIPLN